MGSDNLQRAGEYLYQVMAEICDQVEIHQYQVPCWEVKDWRLEDQNGKEIKSYLFLESGSSEKFEGYVGICWVSPGLGYVCMENDIKL